MEKFMWLDKNESYVLERPFVLVKGSGFCTMKEFEDAYATVEEIRNESKPGILVSANAITILATKEEKRFVVIKRSDDASIDPGLWQFPAGRCDEKELPFKTALRELEEEVKIQSPEHNSWNKSYLRLRGPEIDLLDEGSINGFRGNFIILNNTLEFYYEVILEVENFNGITFKDNESWGREVKLVTQEELLSMLENNLFTLSTSSILKEYFKT